MKSIPTYPVKRNRVASNLPKPSLGATFRRLYEFVKSAKEVYELVRRARLLRSFKRKCDGDRVTNLEGQL